jgi:curli biogenesis system outer membrane secretion channel CsgG
VEASDWIFVVVVLALLLCVCGAQVYSLYLSEIPTASLRTLAIDRSVEQVIAALPGQDSWLKVAITEIDGQGAYDFRETLSNKMQDPKKFRVLGSRFTQELLTEYDPEMRSRSNAERAVIFGRKTGVDLVFFGAIEELKVDSSQIVCRGTLRVRNVRLGSFGNDITFNVVVPRSIFDLGYYRIRAQNSSPWFRFV